MRAGGWSPLLREFLLKAFLAFFALVALLTEVLSPFDLIRPVPLAIAWAVVLIVAGFTVRPKPQWPARPKPFEGIAVAALVGIGAILLFIALKSPPNSADAMAYHMPRVIYWVQAGSVRFFPTPYLNQIMLQPMPEYFVLHTFVLSGGDWFANLPQFAGWVFSAVGVSLIAMRFGARERGQVLAAVFCATIPNGIMQATGAKNDFLMAAFLAAMVYFAMGESRCDAAYCGIAVALALFTKGTAYVFAPPLLAAVWLPRRDWRVVTRAALAAVAVLVINGPQYVRNIDLSGSPLGYDGAFGDGTFRWRNERLGWRETASNALRHLSEQLGGRSEEWNRGVYEWVVKAHRVIGIAPDDPATTWPREQYSAPRNANHEANGPSRWHLLLIVVAIPILAARWRSPLSYYTAAVIAAFFLFSFYLKWQPYQARMLLPLFVASSPVAGVLLERLAPAWLQAGLCLLLLNNTRPYLLENWIRPLKGPRSILAVSREDGYFADLTPWKNKQAYLDTVQMLAETKCRMVALDINNLTLEYPIQALLRARVPGVEFMHTGVKNSSKKYERRPAAPCALVCLDCAGIPDRVEAYGEWGAPTQTGRFLVYRRGR